MATSSTPKPHPARLVRARVERGLTQEELAHLVGCSVFSIGKYERNERSPRGPLLRRIAEVTGHDTDWFFVVDEAGVAA